MFRFFLMLLVMLVACGRPGDNPSQPTSNPTEQLSAKYNLYKSLAPTDGFKSAGTCDALLFATLFNVGSGEEGSLLDAQGQPGQWFRLPGLKSDPTLCSSDISRDMFMGLLTYIWHFKKLSMAQDIWEYGYNHNWQMGQERKPLETRTVFTPPMIGLLAEIIYHLGGEDHPERYFSDAMVYNTDPGFVSHLTLLHLALRGSINKGLADKEVESLRLILRHMSGNPLAQALYHKYTDGDQSIATNLLLTVWPADRLPTTSDWSEEWRTQRSDGDSGLLPGEGGHTHSGGDFLFAAALVLGKI